jgi:hypothetical protein
MLNLPIGTEFDHAPDSGEARDANEQPQSTGGKPSLIRTFLSFSIAQATTRKRGWWSFPSQPGSGSPFAPVLRVQEIAFWIRLLLAPF